MGDWVENAPDASREAVQAGRGFDWVTELRLDLPREERPCLKVQCAAPVPAKRRRNTQQYITCRKGLSLTCL